jgi:ELWxxDGT repeat protein
VAVSVGIHHSIVAIQRGHRLPLIEPLEHRRMLSAELVKEIDIGYQVAALSGNLYYIGGDNSSELWKTDGSAVGTQRVAGGFFSPYEITVAAGRIYITWGGHFFTSISSSDGTEGGTHQLPVFVFNGLSGEAGNLAYLDPFNDQYGQELWKTNGTSSGTSLVKDINPGPNSSQPYRVADMDGKAFFGADDGTHGVEPWISDGTEAGTILLADIAGGASSSNPQDLAPLNRQMLFTATTASGIGLWKTDGTPAGTVLLREMGAGTLDHFRFRNQKEIEGKVFFDIRRSGAPSQIWVTDGTSAGTIPLGELSSDSWTVVNDRLYFIAYGATGRELWKTDGTVSGTTLVKTIGPILANTSGVPGVDVDGTLLFVGDDGVHGRELWRSDGTEAGTWMLSDLYPGPTSSNVSSLLKFEGIVYFTANNNLNGNELWRSDGSVAGTVLVDDINPGSASSDPYPMVVVNDLLLFSARAPAGRQLWRLVVPKAHISGPAMTQQGSAITLSAAQSENPHGPPDLQYAWDLDGDLVFGETGSAAANGDETGVTPVFSSANVPAGEWPVRLEVTNSSGQTSRTTSYIAIVPPNLIALSADAILDWSGSPGARILTLHRGSLSLNGDLSSVFSHISIAADNTATIHLAATQHIKQLTLLDSATLDLADAALSVSLYSQPQQVIVSIRQYIELGKVFSSTAQGDARLGIGYASPDVTSLMITATLLGDVNLDRMVSISDFIDLSSHFSQANANWFDGDVNYDDQVSIADFITLASNFGQTYSPAAPQAAAAIAVPSTGQQSARRRPKRGQVHHRHVGAKLPRWWAAARRWVV